MLVPTTNFVLHWITGRTETHRYDENQRLLQRGMAEASVLQRKIASYGDPRLFALTLASRELAHATQPLVPERLFTTAAGSSENDSRGQGLVGTLLSLLVAERSGFAPTQGIDQPDMDDIVESLTRDCLNMLQDPARNGDVVGTINEAQ